MITVPLKEMNVAHEPMIERNVAKDPDVRVCFILN